MTDGMKTLWVAGGIAGFIILLMIIGATVEYHEKRQRRARRRRQQAATAFRLTAAQPPVPRPRRVATPSPPPMPVAQRKQRAPRNPDLPRVHCEICGHLITVNKNGTVRVHAGTGFSRGMNCGGSSRKAFTYMIQENPVG